MGNKIYEFICKYRNSLLILTVLFGIIVFGYLITQLNIETANIQINKVIEIGNYSFSEPQIMLALSITACIVLCIIIVISIIIAELIIKLICKAIKTKSKIINVIVRLLVTSLLGYISLELLPELVNIVFTVILMIIFVDTMINNNKMVCKK